MENWYFELLKAESNANTGYSTLEAKRALNEIIETSDTPIARDLSMLVLSKISADKRENDNLRAQLTKMCGSDNEVLKKYALGHLTYLEGNHTEARRYLSDIITKRDANKPGLIKRLMSRGHELDHIKGESDEELAERHLEEDVYMLSEELSKKLRRPTENMVCAMKENKFSSIAAFALVVMVGYSGAKNWNSIADMISGIHFPSFAQAQTSMPEPEEDYNMPRATISENNGLVKLVTKYDDGRDIARGDIYRVTWNVDGKDYHFFPDENDKYANITVKGLDHQYNVSATVEMMDRTTVQSNLIDVEKRAKKAEKRTVKPKKDRRTKVARRK